MLRAEASEGYRWGPGRRLSRADSLMNVVKRGSNIKDDPQDVEAVTAVINAGSLGVSKGNMSTGIGTTAEKLATATDDENVREPPSKLKFLSALQGL